MNFHKPIYFAIATMLTMSVASAEQSAALIEPTLKGGTSFSDPPTLPKKYLGLLPPEKETVAAPCGPQYASMPMAIGDRERYAKLQNAAKGTALGLLGKALSTATGGVVQSGGKQEKESQPPLHEDPIPNKQKSKVKDRASGTELKMGGRIASDGLLLSTRIDDIKGKGTVQEIYLERDDCRRVYPIADYTYELWGKWSLSVSWTKTESTYQNGKLIDQQTASGGFFRSGDGFLDLATSQLAFRDAMKSVPPELQDSVGKYQSQLQSEAAAPMWQRLGFAVPESGARSVGNLFMLSSADMQALKDGRYIVIVQVTREQGPFYQAVGVPVTIAPGKEPGALAFGAIAKK
ncbi:MAG TPA: hypothetical protein VET48_08510 [Steroidobacteraceae bacterium]|nr:hypothetical protein [Steroidobacteraceae bacterium]